MKIMQRLFISATLMISSLSCWANGGPVAWSMGMPLGGLVPKQENSIELLREDLNITIVDLDHYTVEANYTLNNPHQVRRVLYGVPLYWVREFVPEQAAAGIGIAVEGKEYRCKAVDPVKRKNEYFVDSEVGDAWCVVEIEVPRGPSVRLKLTYRTEFEHVDTETNKSSRTYFSTRNLKYLLSPAGYWHGKPDFHARIELGPYAASFPTIPKGAKVSDGVITWHVQEADLKVMRTLKVGFDSDPLFHHRQLATFNVAADGYQKYLGEAKASSTLAHKANRYAVANLLDGDPATAWCEGKRGRGEGEAITIRFETKEQEYCSPEGIAIVPGYAKSAETYLQNGRVSKLRIEACDDPSSYAVISSYPSNTYNRSAFFIETDRNFMPSGDVEEKGGKWATNNGASRKEPIPSCLRFTILETAPGERFSDTCISELALVRKCS